MHEGESAEVKIARLEENDRHQNLLLEEIKETVKGQPSKSEFLALQNEVLSKKEHSFLLWLGILGALAVLLSSIPSWILLFHQH
jgi:hypothetical protein